MHESTDWILNEDLNKNIISNQIRNMKASRAAMQRGTIDESCVSLWSLGRTDDPIGVLNQVLGFMAWTQIEDHLHLIARRTATVVSLYNTTSDTYLADTYLADTHVIEDAQHDGDCNFERAKGMSEED